MKTKTVILSFILMMIISFSHFVGDNLEKYPGAKEGMVGNYYLKKVKLRIIE